MVMQALVKKQPAPDFEVGDIVTGEGLSSAVAVATSGQSGKVILNWSQE